MTCAKVYRETTLAILCVNSFLVKRWWNLMIMNLENKYHVSSAAMDEPVGESVDGLFSNIVGPNDNCGILCDNRSTAICIADPTPHKVDILSPAGRLRRSQFNFLNLRSHYFCFSRLSLSQLQARKVNPHNWTSKEITLQGQHRSHQVVQTHNNLTNLRPGLFRHLSL